MLEPTIVSVISFLLVMLVVYLWASQRNVAKARTLTDQEVQSYQDAIIESLEKEFKATLR